MVKTMHFRKSGSMGRETISKSNFPRINQVSPPVRLYRHEIRSVAISHNFNLGRFHPFTGHEGP